MAGPRTPSTKNGYKQYTGRDTRGDSTPIRHEIQAQSNTQGVRTNGEKDRHGTRIKSREVERATTLQIPQTGSTARSTSRIPDYNTHSAVKRSKASSHSTARKGPKAKRGNTNNKLLAIHHTCGVTGITHRPEMQGYYNTKDMQNTGGKATDSEGEGGQRGREARLAHAYTHRRQTEAYTTTGRLRTYTHTTTLKGEEESDTEEEG